jgi:cytochrome c-type biogenesis protein CcmH
MDGVATGARSKPHPASPGHLSRRVHLPAILLVVLVVLASGLYALRGDQAAVRDPDDRAALASGGPRAPLLRDELAAHVARNPGDGRAWVLLARAEFEADRFADAAAAYAKAVSASPKVARDPAVWCEYADALGMAQGGSLAGPPHALVTHALALNPSHPKALEMAGGVAFEARDYDSAARYWRELLVQIPKTTRERGELAAAIARADELAGRK